MINDKKYVFCCVGISLTIILSVALFNWWRDPVGIFGNDTTYEEMSKANCEGKSLVMSGNFNERLFVKNVIRNGTNDYDVIVLGSSRAMGIGEDGMPDDLRLRNFAVSGAVQEDDIAIWHCYTQKMEKLPKMLIIGVDPWLFNINNGESRWKNAFALEYSDGMRDLGLNCAVDNDYTQFSSLISIQYTKESLMKFFKKDQTLAIWESQEKNDEERQIKYGDGSIAYSRKFYRENADESAKNYIKGKVYHLEDYDKLAENETDVFSAFVESMQSNGVQVIFFLPPYHPLVYDYLSKEQKYKCVLEAEQWYRDFASKKGITVIGGYNPASMGLTGKDFLDGMHTKRESVNEYLKMALK